MLFRSHGRSNLEVNAALRKIHCSISDAEVPALPARLWREGSEVARAGGAVGTGFAAGFTPCRVHAGLKIQHVNAIFAFQLHLHGFVFIC